MSDDSPRGTGIYTKDKRAFIGGAAFLLASTAFGVGAWAHAKLWDTNTRLTIVETQQRNDGARQEMTQAHLDRIDSKLDQILERLPR